MADADRYPPIADYALIGDCHSAALVWREASIDWCCLPRFDSGSAFGRLLDRESGGHRSIRPTANGPFEYSRSYLDDTLVLETRLVGPAGEAKLLDCFVVRANAVGTDNRQILRVVEGVRGSVELEVRVAPRFDYGQVRPWIRRHGHRLHSTIGGNDAVLVWCEQELTEDPAHELVGRFAVGPRDRMRLALTYCAPEHVDAGPPEEPNAKDLDELLEGTLEWWREWAQTLRLDTRDEPAARRSGIVLKALTHALELELLGCVVAKPNRPRGTVPVEWFDHVAAQPPLASHPVDDLQILGVARGRAHDERAERVGLLDRPELGQGARAEARVAHPGIAVVPVTRAALGLGQRGGRRGHDRAGRGAYGELVNLTWRWHRRGHSPSDDDWRFLVSLIDHAAERWSEPDCGIWEWAGDPRHFVHSNVLCWSAIDRGIRLADECMRRAPVRRWKRARDEVREAIEQHGYDRKRGVYVQTFGATDMDAALLLLPTVEYLAWDDERMLRTVAAVREELDAGDGLRYRYRCDDGLDGDEGAFLCCSFWLAECLAQAGDPGEARAVFDHAVARANDLGLFPEEIDPRSGEMLGNFPQGLTHLAHIDAAVALANAEHRR